MGNKQNFKYKQNNILNNNKILIVVDPFLGGNTHLPPATSVSCFLLRKLLLWSLTIRHCTCKIDGTVRISHYLWQLMWQLLMTLQSAHIKLALERTHHSICLMLMTGGFMSFKPAVFFNFCLCFCLFSCCFWLCLYFLVLIWNWLWHLM